MTRLANQTTSVSRQCDCPIFPPAEEFLVAQPLRQNGVTATTGPVGSNFSARRTRGLQLDLSGRQTLLPRLDGSSSLPTMRRNVSCRLPSEPIYLRVADA